MKIFILSLKRAHERREFMYPQFMYPQLLNLKIIFEFVDAYDTQDITDAELQEVNRNRLYDRDLSKAEIACAKSHVKACKAVATEKNYKYGLIIEDDVILSPKLSKILDALKTIELSNAIVLLYSPIYKFI